MALFCKRKLLKRHSKERIERQGYNLQWFCKIDTTHSLFSTLIKYLTDGARTISLTHIILLNSAVTFHFNHRARGPDSTTRSKVFKLIRLRIWILLIQQTSLTMLHCLINEFYRNIPSGQFLSTLSDLKSPKSLRISGVLLLPRCNHISSTATPCWPIMRHLSLLRDLPLLAIHWVGLGLVYTTQDLPHKIQRSIFFLFLELSGFIPLRWIYFFS